MHPALVELKNRGLIKQSTDIEVLSKLLNEGSAVYCGFDPTADSLHIGSLLPLTVLKIFKEHGVPIIALVGGGTGSIGDPSFKSEERSMLDWDTISRNCNGIRNVINNILFSDVEVLDNYKWMKDINMLEFLRDYGKAFTVNNMINKESVRSRIERPDQGISFTEFAYPILQGMDFEYLYSEKNCKIQIGGSDQWGNMIAGTDLIHKLHGNDAECGVITLPLLTKSDGTKFGKSESGTVWLSADKTNAFDFFQFWRNITDEESKTMFKYFQPLDGGVDKYITRLENNPVKTKEFFACGMVEIVHGIKTTSQVLNISNILFGNGGYLDDEEAEILISGGIKVFSFETNVVHTLVLSQLAKSRKMAREFIANGAVKINGTKIDDSADETVIKQIFDHYNYFILQRGKNDFVIIKK